MLAVTFLLSLTGFCWLDWVATTLGVQSPYYLIHALHNAHIVNLTWPDVVGTYTGFKELSTFEPNYEAAAYVFALHIYHCLRYWRTFRYDDWLHHILMIGVALPIGVTSASSTLLGYSLFFCTGLPGGIDYALLFLTRNGWLHPLREKAVNRWLNVWVRSPGCISHATLTFVYALSSLSASTSTLQKGIAVLPGLLMFWNGQYFMDQIVTNYAERALEARAKHLQGVQHLA